MTPYLQLLHTIGVSTQQEALAEIARMQALMGSVNAAVIAESDEADFERGTWTFRPIGDYAVGVGIYALVKIKQPTTATPEAANG